MNRVDPLFRNLTAALLLLAAGFGCGAPDSKEGRVEPVPGLTELGSVSDFQARFKADSALPRLVLLLSLT